MSLTRVGNTAVQPPIDIRPQPPIANISGKQTPPVAKGIYASESSLAKSQQIDQMTTAKMAVAVRPTLAPPKALEIRASETVQNYLQVNQKPLEDISAKEDLLDEVQTFIREHDKERREKIYEQFAALGYTDQKKEESSISHEETGTHHGSLQELLALVSKQNNEDSSQEDAEEDAALKEQRRKDAITKKSFDPDRESLLAISDQRELHNSHSRLAFDEIRHSKEYSSNLQAEMDKLFESLNKRSKGSKVLGWVGKIANIVSGGSAIVIAAVALATGGVGAILGVVPAAAQLVAAGARLGSGIMKMQSQHDQAVMTRLQAERDLLKDKVHDLLSDSQFALRILNGLWATSNYIVKNMTRVITNNLGMN